MKIFSEYYDTCLRIIAITGIFIYGCIESKVFKRTDWACGTWLMGLIALTAWIAYPMTRVRIISGFIVFISGIIFMTVYYKKSKGSMPE